MATLRSMPRWVTDSLRTALIVAVGLTLFSVYSARGTSHDTVYWACLYGGSLSQVGTTEPANCGRGTTISWNSEGVQGAPGMSGYEIVEGVDLTVGTGGGQGQSVNCPEGKKVLGGGPRFVEGWEMTMDESNPNLDGGGWFAFVRNTSEDTELTFRVVIACAFVEPEAAPFQPYQLENDSPRRSQ